MVAIITRRARSTGSSSELPGLSGRHAGGRARFDALTGETKDARDLLVLARASSMTVGRC